MKRYIVFAIAMMAISAVEAKVVRTLKSVVATENSSEYADLNRFYASYSGVSVTMAGQSFDETISGFKFGYLHEFSLSEENGFVLDWGFEFQYNTYSEKVNLRDILGYGSSMYGDVTLKYLAINMPLNLGYKIDLGDNWAFTPYTGLKLRLNALAEIEDVSLFDDKYLGDETANRIQVGWQIGGGLSYKAFYIGGQYGIDLTNFMYKTHFSEFNVTLGVNF